MLYTIFDLETTGFNGTSDAVCLFALAITTSTRKECLGRSRLLRCMGLHVHSSSSTRMSMNRI